MKAINNFQTKRVIPTETTLSLFLFESLDIGIFQDNIVCTTFDNTG